MIKANSAIMVFLAALSAGAAPLVYPYGASEPWNVRFETNGVQLVDEAVDVPQVAAMPVGDRLAKLTAEGCRFAPVDALDWDGLVADISSTRAMLTLKAKSDGSVVWMGGSGTTWCELYGLEAVEGEYDVVFDFDQSLSEPVVRYRVKPSSSADYVTLTNAQGVAWMPNGAAAPLTSVKFKGTGSIAAAWLASAERPVDADVGEVVEDYAYDYSNLTFRVAVNEAYGDGLKLRVQLFDAQGGSAGTVEKALAVGTENVVDVSPYVDAGKVYDYRLSLVSGDAVVSTLKSGKAVLASELGWWDFSSGEWHAATAVHGEVKGGVFVPAFCEEAVITPEEAAAAGAYTRVEMTMVTGEGLPTADDLGEVENVQGALTLTTAGWYCWNATTAAWVAISAPLVPYVAGTYQTLTEFDYTLAAPKVSYSVKVGDEWKRLSDKDGTGWFPLPVAAKKLYEVGVWGEGGVAAAVATYDTTAPLPPAVDGSTITLSGSSELALGGKDAKAYTLVQPDGRRYRMTWKDGDGKYAVRDGDSLTVKSGTPANGMSSYASYALGLDPDVAASKPVLDAVQNADGSSVAFRTLNVSPREDEVEVAYEVSAADTPDGTYEKVADAEGGSASVAIDGAKKVRYYKLDIRIKTK